MRPILQSEWTLTNASVSCAEAAQRLNDLAVAPLELAVQRGFDRGERAKQSQAAADLEQQAIRRLDADERGQRLGPCGQRFEALALARRRAGGTLA
mgnify:CR=1 FL=1